MDTVEELNGTYFYAGKSNLNAAQLLFMIFCENTASQFGIGVADFGAVVALVSGRSNLGTRGKFANATKGTSYASKSARAVFRKSKFPFGISLPTWLGGYTPWTARRVMVRNIAPLTVKSPLNSDSWCVLPSKTNLDIIFPLLSRCALIPCVRVHQIAIWIFPGDFLVAEINVFHVIQVLAMRVFAFRHDRSDRDNFHVFKQHIEVFNFPPRVVYAIPFHLSRIQ